MDLSSGGREEKHRNACRKEEHMKRKKRMLLLLGLLIILCGAYGGIRGWNAHLKSEKAAKKKTQTVKIINAENLAKINYAKGNKNMSFVKKNNTWKYTKDKSITLIQSSESSIEGSYSNIESSELSDIFV